MRHRQHRFSLGRKKEHRVATMRNLAAALIRHGRIKTTVAKAKALRPFIEPLITMAKKAHGASPERALHLRRLATARLRDKEACALLFRERVTEFLDRAGGYTRIYKLGTRVGDAAEMAIIQLIPADDEGYEKPKRGKKSSGAAKPAAAPAEETSEETEAEPVAAESAPAEEAEEPAKA
jgi:large subunit ribosomal protein L17